MSNLLELESIYFAFKNILKVIAEYQSGKRISSLLEFIELVELCKLNCKEDFKIGALNTLAKLRICRAHEQISEIPNPRILKSCCCILIDWLMEIDMEDPTISWANLLRQSLCWCIEKEEIIETKKEEEKEAITEIEEEEEEELSSDLSADSKPFTMHKVSPQIIMTRTLLEFKDDPVWHDKIKTRRIMILDNRRLIGRICSWSGTNVRMIFEGESKPRRIPSHRVVGILSEKV